MIFSWFFLPFFSLLCFFSSSSSSLPIEIREGGGVALEFALQEGGDVELSAWLPRSMAGGARLAIASNCLYYSRSERLGIWIRVLLSVCLFCPDIIHVGSFHLLFHVLC